MGFLSRLKRSPAPVDPADEPASARPTEFAGNELAGGWAVLYLGPSADRIAEAVLRSLGSLRPGSYLVRRYGDPEASESAKSRQNLIR